MSYNWSFHSFDYEKFQYALAHSRRKVVDALVDELRASNNRSSDTERCARVGDRLVEQGFRYEGWPAGELKIVDSFVTHLFYSCADEIESQPESPEFLSPNVTAEFPTNVQKRTFWGRPKPVPAKTREYVYLPLFAESGRRLGQQVSFPCEYIILDAQETRSLRSEIEKFLASPGGQLLESEYLDSIQKDFLGPVASAVRKNKSFYARLS